MRYMLVEWLGEKPADREVLSHLFQLLGRLGIVESKLRVQGDVVACENAWLDKVRGALALRWQFRVKKLTGTKKSLGD